MMMAQAAIPLDIAARDLGSEMLAPVCAASHRLAQLPRFGGRIGVCVDAPEAVADLAAAVARHGFSLDVLVEYDANIRCWSA